MPADFSWTGLVDEVPQPTGGTTPGEELAQPAAACPAAIEPMMPRPRASAKLPRECRKIEFPFMLHAPWWLRRESPSTSMRTGRGSRVAINVDKGAAEKSAIVDRSANPRRRAIALIPGP